MTQSIGGNVNRLNAVLSALRKENKRRGKAMERGLVKGGLRIQRESQKIVPIDTSALKNSARTTKKGSGHKTEVTVSYGTEYAVFVHEDLNARHASGKSAKFLEIPVRRLQREIAADIKAEVKKA